MTMSRREFGVSAIASLFAAAVSSESAEAQVRRKPATAPAKAAATTPPPVPTEVGIGSITVNNDQAKALSKSRPKEEMSVLSNLSDLKTQAASAKAKADSAINAVAGSGMPGAGTVQQGSQTVEGLKQVGSGLVKVTRADKIVGKLFGGKDERGADLFVQDTVQDQLSKGSSVVLVYGSEERALKVKEQLVATTGLGKVMVVSIDPESKANEDFKKHFREKGDGIVVWKAGADVKNAASAVVFMTNLEAMDGGIVSALKAESLAQAPAAVAKPTPLPVLKPF